MTYALLATIVLLAAGHIVLLDRKDKRSHAERERERQIVERLLVHIQAPEVAVATHVSQQPQSTPQAVDAFNDEDYWSAREVEQQALQRLDELARQMP